MDKVFKKIVTTILIVIAAIVLWFLLVFITTNGGTGRSFAPIWTSFALLGGVFAVIRVWTTGWTDKSKEDPDKKDLLKL